MKINKTIVVGLTTTALVALSIGSTYAMYGYGQGQGKIDRVIVDTNNNGIQDGLEDFDNDGILNRDESDYVKTYVNMRDDDSDGIANRYDTDYIRSQNGTGRGMGKGQGLGQKITTDERAKLFSMDQTERMEYVQELSTKYNITQGRGMRKGMR